MEETWKALKKRVESKKRAIAKQSPTDIEMRGYILGQQDLMAWFGREMKGLESGEIPLEESRTDYYKRLEENRAIGNE